MVTPFAIVLGALVFSSLQPGVTSTFGRPPQAMNLAATVDSFSPPAPNKAKRRRPKPARRPPAPTKSTEGASADEDTPASRPAPRGRPPAADETEEDESTGGGVGARTDGEEEEQEPRAKRRVVRRRAPANDEGSDDDEETDHGEDDEGDDDDDDDDVSAAATLPVVSPRLITFGVGASFVGRSFAFDAPTLRKDGAFARPGVTTSLEIYPLIRARRGWYRKLGLGGSMAMEFGSADLRDASTGLTLSYPVAQRRYSFDVRYAITAGQRLVIVPAVGVGNNTFDLKSNMPLAPSACNNMAVIPPGIAVPCVADVQATYLVADLHLRVATSDSLAITLSGGYFRGMAIGRGLGQIGQERTAVMAGFHGELGLTKMVNHWLALRGAIPIIRYGYSFSGGTGATYTSAAETYYGLSLCAILFTN